MPGDALVPTESKDYETWGYTPSAPRLWLLLCLEGIRAGNGTEKGLFILFTVGGVTESAV